MKFSSRDHTGLLLLALLKPRQIYKDGNCAEKISVFYLTISICSKATKLIAELIILHFSVVWIYLGINVTGPKTPGNPHHIGLEATFFKTIWLFTLGATQHGGRDRELEVC